jgi:hypothetical protein
MLPFTRAANGHPWLGLLLRLAVLMMLLPAAPVAQNTAEGVDPVYDADPEEVALSPVALSGAGRTGRVVAEAEHTWEAFLHCSWAPLCPSLVVSLTFVPGGIDQSRLQEVEVPLSALAEKWRDDIVFAFVYAAPPATHIRCIRLVGVTMICVSRALLLTAICQKTTSCCRGCWAPAPRTKPKPPSRPTALARSADSTGAHHFVI